MTSNIANIVSDLTAAIGPIKTGSVQFGEFVVPNQAFSTYGSSRTKSSKHDADEDTLSVDSSNSIASVASQPRGIIGVGPYAALPATLHVPKVEP